MRMPLCTRFVGQFSISDVMFLVSHPQHVLIAHILAYISTNHSTRGLEFNRTLRTANYTSYIARGNVGNRAVVGRSHIRIMLRIVPMVWTPRSII